MGWMCEQESAAEDECMWIKTDRTGWEHVCESECVCALTTMAKLLGHFSSVSGFRAPTGAPMDCVCKCMCAHVDVFVYMYAIVFVCVCKLQAHDKCMCLRE